MGHGEGFEGGLSLGVPGNECEDGDFSAGGVPTTWFESFFALGGVEGDVSTGVGVCNVSTGDGVNLTGVGGGVEHVSTGGGVCDVSTGSVDKFLLALSFFLGFSVDDGNLTGVGGGVIRESAFVDLGFDLEGLCGGGGGVDMVLGLLLALVLLGGFQPSSF